MTYGELIESKRITIRDSGFYVDTDNLNPRSFQWQKDITRWAIRKGKAALFEDCGLGKTIQQLDYADQVCRAEGTNAILFTPLAVARQTEREARKFGISANIIETHADIKPGINITNYEKLDKFDLSSFGCVVLDESSILKHGASKTRIALTDKFRTTPYKLCCSATPAPNDFMEIGNHAEFLGVMSHREMLSTFFVHDSGDTSKWRLKGHAEDKFWEWIAGWAVVLTTPGDLGYDDTGYNLPPLHIHEHIVRAEKMEDTGGQLLLLPEASQTLNARRAARRNSLAERVAAAAEIANATDEQVLVWCDLNDESTALAAAIPDAVEVRGSDKDSHKIETMSGFSKGDVMVMVSKPSIAGWGMNWQNCRNMIFVGLSDSFEAYYQAMRRCWRYGQEHEVNVHIVISDAEGAVKANIERKQRDMVRMTRELVAHTRNILSADLMQTTRISENYIAAEIMRTPDWLRRKAG